MTDPIIVDVVNGTFTCPDHPDVGPIIVGYHGAAPPAQVSVTHDDEGVHTAKPVEAIDAGAPLGEAPGTEGPAGDPSGEGGNGGEGDGADAATQQGDGNPPPTPEGEGGSTGA